MALHSCKDRTGGRIRATKSDRFVRYLQVPTADGPKEIAVRGSKDASELARYLSAINQYLNNENPAAIAEWRGRKIADIELITDDRTLKALGEEEFHIDSLYRSLSGGAA